MVLVGAGWLVVTALLARRELNTSRAELSVLRTEVLHAQAPRAAQQADQLRGHLRRAHQLTTGPAWWIAAAIPWAGEPFDTMRGVTSGGDQLGQQTLPALIRLGGDLDPSKLRTAGDTIDITRLAAAAPTLHTAAGSLAATATSIAQLPKHSWLGAVNAGRSSFQTDLDTLSHTVDAADKAAQVLPPLLGANGPRRYFVGLQNEAESRGTGGLPGIFAIVVADHGTLHLTHIAADSELSGVSSGLDFGPEYDALYGNAAPTRTYGNSNISPNFPYAARIWAAMWQRTSGQHVDGAVALDPTALGYLLAATGPAHLPGGTSVTATNVVSLTEKDAYATYPDGAARKDYLVGLARAAESRLLGGSGSAAALVQAGRRAADERRLLVWSSDTHVEAVLAGTSLGGVVPQTSRPYAGLVVVNAAGTKLDYYLRRSLTWQRDGCNPHSVTATIALDNAVPAGPLPAYVATRNDHPRYATQPGDNRLIVQYYATAGSQLRGATVDGKTVLADPQQEGAHPVYSFDVEMPRGATRTLVLRLSDPSASGQPEVLAQPLVQPMVEHLPGPAPCKQQR